MEEALATESMTSPPPPPLAPQHDDGGLIITMDGGGAGGSSKDQLANNNNNNIVVKGKRTKRQRPQSPIPFRITSTSTPLSNDNNNNSSSRSDDGSDICSNIQDISNNLNNSSPLLKINNSSIQDPPAVPLIPTSSSDEYYNSDYYCRDSAVTDEEEDMANCLILLSQGQPRNVPSYSNMKQQQERARHEELMIGSGSGSNRFSSRKFMEAPTTANGKAGYYVYECKTCGKTFPSFQALGGHRASHKKPKNINKELLDHDHHISRRNSANNLVQMTDEEDGLPLPSFETNNSLSLQLSNRALFNHQNTTSTSHNKPRVHECSICGAEFSSGQALGGHMRRHRGGGGASHTTVALSFMSANPVAAEPVSSVAMVDVDQKQQEEEQKGALSLELDLNLPAPSEEDHHHRHQLHNNSQKEEIRESKFQFASKQAQDHQQPNQLISSSPATLVDCHY